MEYKHFSHKHPLTLLTIQPGQQYQCHGCHLPCRHDSIFTCRNCNFFLHQHCGNANRYVKHLSHASHPLILVPSPTYCSGSFICNACGAPGSAFSYCCALCEVDLHVNCTYLPSNVSHNAHQHELFLSFTTPEIPNNPDYCKVCRKELNSTHWSYFCDKPECNFRVHTSCATNEVKPGLYQDVREEAQTPAFDNSTTNQNTNVHQMHDQTELTPEELMLGIAQLRMEYDLAQALGNIIAYYPN